MFCRGRPRADYSARPRGRLVLCADGEPVYGPRDRIDVPKVAALGLPFWPGGRTEQPGVPGRGPGAAGATGIQVGTAFALCRESGMEAGLKERLRRAVAEETLVVHNDVRTSPTGFPFKQVSLAGTVADEAVYSARPRLCDLGYLRTPYLRANGAVGYRCPAEPVDAYVRKGGNVDDTVGSRCLCNGLVATVGLSQRRADGYLEPPLVTLGQDVSVLARLMRQNTDFTAADVVDDLLRERST